MAQRDCPKCQSSMQEGWTLQADSQGGRGISSWVEGKPVKSFWLGVKLGGKTPVTIEAWRCTRCGFLEHYAKP